MPQPSPRTNPSAPASKVRHLPLFESIPASRMNFVTAGERTAFTNKTF